MASTPDSNPLEKSLPRRPFLAVSLAGIATLTACGSQVSQNSSASSSVSTNAGGSAAATGSTSASPSANKAPFGASVEFNVQPNDKAYDPAKAVTGTVTNGTFVSATLMAEGATVETASIFNSSATTWSTTAGLKGLTKYTLTYTLKDKTGATQDKTFTFTTTDGKVRVDTTVNITNKSQNVGVGRIAQFYTTVAISDKAAYEKAISVTVNGAPIAGKFRWYNDRMVRFRPEKYWPANSTVAITINNQDQPLGGNNVGNTKDTITFITGDKRYALADNNTKKIDMYVNDQLVYTAPITLGDKDWPSVVGKLVIMEQAPTYFFDPTTLGLKEGDPHYYTPFYAHNVSRLTESGVFVHTALPAAYSSIGVANVSHGCIGMMPDDDKFFFDTFKPGDVIETINTGYPQANPDNGYGDWNIPYENYSDSNWKGNW